MHLKSFLLGCAALLPATLAQLTPPANFLLQARTIKGVSANNQFNKQYLIVETTNKGNAVPLFTRVNGYAEFFVLSNPDATSNGTFYTLETNSAYSAASLATMEYNADPFARFEPVMFETLAKGAAPSKQQIGFYIGGTKTDMELLWTDKYNKPTAGDFSGWLICYWQYLTPQLFFLSKGQNPANPKYPSTCEVVSLMVIPAQPS